MNMADPEPAAPMPAEAPPGPSQTSLDDLAPAATEAAHAAQVEDVAAAQGCPFLFAQGGGWRLDTPTRDHCCAAVSPPSALSLEKQARLCLTAAHVDCATFLASRSARGMRLGTPALVRTTRWGLARTTTVIEDAGGLRARVIGLLLDRRRWPAIPAVILVTTLVVLAFSGLRGGSATPVATASPTRPSITLAPTLEATNPPTVTEAPSSAPSPVPTSKPSATPAASTGPSATFRTYRVKSGDTLSGIASNFGTTPRAIADLNGISVGTTLHIGQVLKIPNPAP